MCWTVLVGSVSFSTGRLCSSSGESSLVDGVGYGGLGGMYGSGIGCGVAGFSSVFVFAFVAASS